MKKLFITLTATLVCISASGQSKMLFDINTDNLIYLTTNISRIVWADRTTTVDGGYGCGLVPIAGSSLYTGLTYLNNSPGTIMSLAGSPTFIAALYAGYSSNSLTLLETTTLGGASNPGGINSVSMTTGFLYPSGTPVWFQVQVFDNRANASPDSHAWDPT
jgi:hypothetical protein